MEIVRIHPFALETARENLAAMNNREVVVAAEMIRSAQIVYDREFLCHTGRGECEVVAARLARLAPTEFQGLTGISLFENDLKGKPSRIIWATMKLYRGKADYQLCESYIAIRDEIFEREKVALSQMNKEPANA